MMELMIHACSLTLALAMTTHRCRRTPAPILHPGPITTLGPMLEKGRNAVGSGRAGAERKIGAVDEQGGRVDLGGLAPRRMGRRVSWGKLE